MASVFLSYDRDDGDKARPLAGAMEKAGHQVWWDLHVRGGAQFSKVIEEALKAADVVVVLWSANSIESAWVRDEAAAGRDTGRLVPATIDGTEPPMGFRQFQTIDLSPSNRRRRRAAIKTLLEDIATAGKSSGSEVRRVEPAKKLIKQDRKPWTFALTALVATIVLAIAVAVWRPWATTTTVPTVLVTPGRNDAISQALARDFAVQLGGASLVQSGSLRLVTSTQSSSEKPALALEVSSLAQPQTSGASLLLRTTTDNAVIWSRDFEQGQRSIADMNLQMAYTAAHVLGCATDAFAGNGNLLPRQARALYLTSCGQTPESADFDSQTIVASLSKVVAEAPRFTPAWRKLLLAEADVADPWSGSTPPRSQQETLRKHIAAARRLDPHMPEATLAEIALVPSTDLVTRMRLIDQAYRDRGDNPTVLMSRAGALAAVGRTLEAVATATDAAQIDPTSAETLSNYILVLMYSGRTEMAEQQLKRAERLWPGTATLENIRWNFYFRIGDPKIGLQMASDRTLYPSMQLFIQARANPTQENIEKLTSFYKDRYKDRLKDPLIGTPSLFMLSQAFGPFHRENELYDIALHWPTPHDLAGQTDTWFRPALHDFRRDPRFMQLAAHTPLLRYWRTTGNWPDFCSEPDLPYDCKKEAAKYRV